MTQTSAFRLVPAPRSGPALVRLNLGCGLRRMGGFIHIDKSPDVKPDLVWDLTVNIPFDENSAAEIHAYDFLEHLPTPRDLIRLVNECWRVLVPDGFAVFRTPNVLSKAHPTWAHRDPTHRLWFNVESWTYFQQGHPHHEHNGRYDGILPWSIGEQGLILLDGDGTIQVTMQPVKGTP